MKNKKIFIILAGIIAVLFGFAAKNQGALQQRLGMHVKIDTQKYLMASECGGEGHRPTNERSA